MRSTPNALRSSSPKITLGQAAERALAVDLLRFPEALELAVSEWKPNVLCDYLFGLANDFSAFFENCPVLKADNEALKLSRLALCDLTARTLSRGLDLLGIRVVERM